MDILNPNVPAIPHKEATGQAAIDDAERNLSLVKKLSKETTAEATNLVKAAKDLVKEAIFNYEESKKKRSSGEWTQAELDQSRTNLMDKQEKAWVALEAKSEELQRKIDTPYKLLWISKENILRARGDGVTGAILGVLTPDQKNVRKVFDNKLKAEFDQAAAAMAGLTSYPDGLLTQIPLLRKKSVEHLKQGMNAQGNLFLAAAQEQAK